MASAQAALAAPARKGSRLAHRRRITGFLFVLPSVLFMLMFFIFPLIMTVWMSLHNWPLLGKPKFIGLANYANMMQDGQFWSSLIFTTEYTLLVTIPIFMLAFVLALLVNLPLRGVGIFRTGYFVPVVIGLGTSSLLWVWLLNDRVGIFNRILIDLGLTTKSVVWFVEKGTAMAAIIISVVWKTVGFTMILLLSGMQAIPDEIYQAAMVDGATYWGRLLHITHAAAAAHLCAGAGALGDRLLPGV